MSGTKKQSSSRHTHTHDHYTTIIDALHVHDAALSTATNNTSATTSNPIKPSSSSSLSSSRHHSNHNTNHHNNNHHHHHSHTHHHNHSHNGQNHHHSGHRNDAERMRKKFRDAIYVGNYERVERIIKNILENDTLDLSSVLLPYASRHVTPIGLAARRGHVKICRVLVDVIKQYVLKQHYNQHLQTSNAHAFVSGPMLDLLSKEEEAKDKEKSGEEDEEQEEQEEVEDNNGVNGGDDSSSEQHNNTTQSISPQPTCNNPQIVSLEAQIVSNEDEQYSILGENKATQETANKESKKRKKKSKHKTHIMRSSSSGALIDDHQTLSLETHSQETHEIQALQDTKSGESTATELMMLHKHRKTRSLPYIHLHSMLNRLDGENRTALSHACEKGQREVIEFLLSEPGIAIEAGGKHHEESWTNLHWACRYGHDQIVQLLLDHNANINAQTSKKKSTGLHLACATGHTEVIHVLLQNGAAKEIEDVYGCSPLSLAIHFGEKKVQQILYEAGIDVSPHDARRLKKDNHIFRRFGWIKIPPSISTKVMLPDDVWCVVCGFLPCDELLLNVRLVSFGFLYVVHHPALRKLVNFKRSLPDKDKVDELVQYNEGHQTLVLKAPSPENNFNVNAAPFAFMAPPMHPMVGVGGVPFAPPPPAAAAILAAHGAPPIPHPHAHAPVMHPHLPLHHSVSANTNNQQHAPNPFGNFPHFMIPAPHHPHNNLANNINNRTDNDSNNNNNTQQLQSSLPPPPPPPTLQSIYNNTHRHSNNNNSMMITRSQSNSLPTVARHHTHHRSYQSIDLELPENNANTEDFTPPPIPPDTQMTQNNAPLFTLVQRSNNNNNNNQHTADNESLSALSPNNNNVSSLPASQSDLANIIDLDDNDRDNSNNEEDDDMDEDDDDTTHLDEQLANMNGTIASLILDHVTPTNNAPAIEEHKEHDTPIPSDTHRPTPILTTQSTNKKSTNTNPRNRLINLETIHSLQSTHPAKENNDNKDNTNSNDPLVKQLTIMGGTPPILSRNYSHNNFVEQNQDFQRFMSISPPLSPSLNQHNHNNENANHPVMNQLPPRNTNHLVPMPRLLQFTPAQVVVTEDNNHNNHSTNNHNNHHHNNNAEDIFNIAPWNTADMMSINNPMLNNGAHYAMDAMNRADHKEVDGDDRKQVNQDMEEDKKENEQTEDEAEDSESDICGKWQYKHCRWLACAVNFGPSNLRKIRLTGTHILTQPLIRVLSCLSFIVHLELAHFHAYKLVTMDLKHLQRVSQLKMIRQLKVFPVIRNNSYSSAMYDAVAVATFITQIGSTALTLGIKYESIEISDKEEQEIEKTMNGRQISYKNNNTDNNEDEDNKVMALTLAATSPSSSSETADAAAVDMATLSSLTWKSLFDHLPSNLRSLRLHFGKDDSLKSGAVDGLKNFESIKCFTLHGDPGLYGQIKEWSDVFQRWNKLRYIVLGHRNNTKELQVPKEILQALPPMLPELALNISVHSIPNVVWYLKHVVKAECFLRINLHVVHKHKSDLYHASIHQEIIPCLTRFHNLETAYLKCGMVTLEQIELLLENCKKVSFVGFGIDAQDEKQVKSFKLLLEDYGFDKIVVKGKLNWLIAVKSYDKLLLDPTRCIHPVLEAFDDKSCQIMQPLHKKPKPKMIMPHNTHLQPL